MYQRSTSFDVGVFTDDFSLGLSYHKDVEEVYKSITATGQAVGKLIFARCLLGLFFKIAHQTVGNQKPIEKFLVNKNFKR